MVIDRRRALLALTAWAAAGGHAHAAPAKNAGTASIANKPRSAHTRLAAAWHDGELPCVGLLQASAAQLQLLKTVPVPTRAHGLLALADGTLVFVARRPGDWLLHWHPARGRPVYTWAEVGRSFNGHALASADGRLLYTTETDLDSGASLIAVRDAASGHKRAEWPTHGIDAHMMLLDRDGASLLVANGGVPTAPETGRVKRDLQRMDSSLVRLSLATGELLGQWRLPDARLSQRHLAKTTTPEGSLIGVALQAEHDAPEVRAAAPLLAVFDGQRLLAVAGPAGGPWAGYGGDIAAMGEGFAVSATRASAVLAWQRSAGWQVHGGLAEACALAPAAGGLLAGGRSQRLALHGDAAEASALPAGLRLDNHWLVLPG